MKSAFDILVCIRGKSFEFVILLIECIDSLN